MGLYLLLCCVRVGLCESITSIHVIHRAQHVVRRAGQAADAQTAVGALVARVSTAQRANRISLSYT